MVHVDNKVRRPTLTPRPQFSAARQENGTLSLMAANERSVACARAGKNSLRAPGLLTGDEAGRQRPSAHKFHCSYSLTLLLAPKFDPRAHQYSIQSTIIISHLDSTLFEFHQEYVRHRGPQRCSGTLARPDPHTVMAVAASAITDMRFVA